ncbi:hypothetical protein M5K25_004151 [Dendrobium thyrsiflorum]|uniref:Uncharacterized protein n=1 Tax=Dendrobium thyrsiflorum TaxID=117978 RepID=A0ABD0VSP9_DENTH
MVRRGCGAGNGTGMLRELWGRILKTQISSQKSGEAALLKSLSRPWMAGIDWVLIANGLESPSVATVEAIA